VVRIAKGSYPARNTHCLSSTERGTRQDSKSKPASEGTHILLSMEQGTGQDSKRKPGGERHSPAVERRAGDWLRQRKNASKRGGLTGCQVQSEGLIRTANENQQARDTHGLLREEQETSQD
jgi:hypothetical protein